MVLQNSAAELRIFGLRIFGLQEPSCFWGLLSLLLIASSAFARNGEVLEPPVEVVALDAEAGRAVVKSRAEDLAADLQLLAVGDSIGDSAFQVTSVLADRLILDYADSERRLTFWLYPPKGGKPATFRVLDFQAPAPTLVDLRLRIPQGEGATPGEALEPPGPSHSEGGPDEDLDDREEPR